MAPIGIRTLVGLPIRQSPLSWLCLEGGKQIFGGQSKELACFPGLFWLPMTKAQVKVGKAKTKEERRNRFTLLKRLDPGDPTTWSPSLNVILSIFAAFPVGLPHMMTTRTTKRTACLPYQACDFSTNKMPPCQIFIRVPGLMLPGSCWVLNYLPRPSLSPVSAPGSWVESPSRALSAWAGEWWYPNAKSKWC